MFHSYLKLYIVVIGWGRLGSILASDLSQQDHQVMVKTQVAIALTKLFGLK